MRGKQRDKGHSVGIGDMQAISNNTPCALFAHLPQPAGNGHLAVVSGLLAAGASPPRTNSRGEMAVTLALKKGHLPVVRRLLEHTGELAPLQASEAEASAAAAGSVAPEPAGPAPANAAASPTLPSGAPRLQLTNASKAWQMGFASGMLPRMRPLSLAALEQERQRVQLLLLALLRAHASSGSSAESRAAAVAEVRQLATPAAVANAAAGSDALLAALLACGVSLGVVDPADGSFPLLAAAHNGWQPMLRLLQHGADPNQCDALGNSVLHLLASRPGMLETAQHLLALHFGQQGGSGGSGVQASEASGDSEPQQQQGQQWEGKSQQPQASHQQRQQQQLLLDVGRLNVAGLDALGAALAANNRKFAELLLEHLIVAQQREQSEQRERQLAMASGAAEAPAAAAVVETNGAAAEQQPAAALAAQVLPAAADVQPTAAAAKACNLLVELGAKALADINKPRGAEAQHILVSQVRWDGCLWSRSFTGAVDCVVRSVARHHCLHSRTGAPCKLGRSSLCARTPVYQAGAVGQPQAATSAAGAAWAGCECARPQRPHPNHAGCGARAAGHPLRPACHRQGGPGSQGQCYGSQRLAAGSAQRRCRGAAHPAGCGCRWGVGSVLGGLALPWRGQTAKQGSTPACPVTVIAARAHHP